MLQWIQGIIEGAGYLGIAFLMFAENVFPPIPSELIMPIAGFSAARGDMNLILAIVAGTIGTVAGALLWYYVGYWVGDDRLKDWARKHGRWLTLKPQEVDKASRWFENHGGGAILIGRMVPAVRTLISVPAGIVEMGMAKFLLFTTIGTIGWTALLTIAGYALGENYQAVSAWVNPVSNVIVAVIVLWYLYRVATFRRKVPKHQGERG
ncbi:MAG: DedA family protein [Geminicoccaceae bacterium]|nr:DedA family protein [Geminicoccaceae bacterium]